MSDDALGLVSLLEALPSEHTQNDPAQLGDDLTPDLIKQQFQTGSLTMDISSGEESDGQENIESADDFNLNTAQKCNLEKRLDRLEVEKITKELHTTANDVCPNGGFPQLLLQVRKPKLSADSFQMAEQATQMCLVDKKLRFTLAKQMEVSGLVAHCLPARANCPHELTHLPQMCRYVCRSLSIMCRSRRN